MSDQGRAEKRRDETSKSNLDFQREVAGKDGLVKDLTGIGCGLIGRDISFRPKPKVACKYAGASSTEDESGWESELDVETDVESGMDSDVGADDDGFEADSEGEFGQSPIAKIASINHFPTPGFVGGNLSGGPPLIPFNKFFFVPATGEFVALETDCEDHADDDGVDEVNNVSNDFGCVNEDVNLGFSCVNEDVNLGFSCVNEDVNLVGQDGDGLDDGDVGRASVDSDTEVEDCDQSDNFEDIFDGKPFLTVDEVVVVAMVEEQSVEADLKGEEVVAKDMEKEVEKVKEKEEEVELKQEAGEEEQLEKEGVKLELTKEVEGQDVEGKEFKAESYAERDDSLFKEPEEGSSSCPIVCAERNLNMLINVITETQQHLNEIFAKHNIPYDFSAPVEEDESAFELREETECRRDGVEKEDKIVITGNEDLALYFPSNASVRSGEGVEGEEDDEDVTLVVSKCETLTSSPEVEPISSTIESSRDMQMIDPFDDEHCFFFDTQVGLLLVPSICLMCSLFVLCIINFFTVAQVLSTTAMAVISVNVVLVTFCHLYQILLSKAVVNPFRAYLDQDLMVAFSILNHSISSILLRCSISLEFLKRAFLFGDLLNSLKLILVTCLFCHVGHLFTVPQLVVSLNLLLFFSQFELKSAVIILLHRSKECFLTVLKRFF